MPLDPQAKVMLDLINSVEFARFDANTDVVATRALMEAAIAPSSIELARIEDRTIPGPLGAIPIRIYAPAGTATKPVIVFFHGGGWVIGSLATHDDLCRRLAAEVDAVVVAVDYRLAPEHRFPAAVGDSYAAFSWVQAHASELGGDAARLAVAGDSAGGNLAAVVARRARDDGHALRFQLLVYPITDHEFSSASMDDNAEDYYLTRDAMRWFYDRYLTDPTEGDDPDVSPIRAEDLTGLAPALVITAGYDPLRDQGLAYADALRAAGNEVESKRYDGMFHGFFSMSAMIDTARVANRDAARALRAGLA